MASNREPSNAREEVSNLAESSSDSYYSSDGKEFSVSETSYEPSSSRSSSDYDDEVSYIKKKTKRTPPPPLVLYTAVEGMPPLAEVYDEQEMPPSPLVAMLTDEAGHDGDMPSSPLVEMHSSPLADVYDAPETPPSPLVDETGHDEGMPSSPLVEMPSSPLVEVCDALVTPPSPLVAMLTDEAGHDGDMPSSPLVEMPPPSLAIYSSVNEMSTSELSTDEVGQISVGQLLNALKGADDYTWLSMDIAANENVVHAFFYNDFDDLFDEDEENP